MAWEATVETMKAENPTGHVLFENPTRQLFESQQFIDHLFHHLFITPSDRAAAKTGPLTNEEVLIDVLGGNAEVSKSTENLLNAHTV